MAEHIEEPEAEAAAGAEPIAPAAALAVGLRKGRSRDKADPKLDAFLDEQTRLVRLQSEHLHEQRQVALARLKLGRWKDRVSLVLQGMTAVVGLVVAAAIGVMAWQAHRDHGLVVAPFSVPPDLAQRGLTGQVVASRMLDRLAQLEVQTVSTRPASTYAHDWGEDIKVEIPETGVSVGELHRSLREWLGHEARVSGEVVRTPAGLQVTARAGEDSGATVQGAETDVDGLIGQAAESLYRQTQPYRYAVYLASRGQRDEASKAFAALATSGTPEDRPWAYAGWASILQEEGRHYEAIRMANASIALNPNLEPPYQTLGVSSDVVGQWDAKKRNPSAELSALRSGRGVGRPKDQLESRSRFLQAVQAFYLSDYQSAAAALAPIVAFDLEGRALGFTPQHLRSRALGALHEVTAAEQANAGPVDTNSYQAIPARGLTLGDWAEVARRLEAGAHDPALAGDAQRTLVASLLAEAYAHLGRLPEAKALIAGAPLDCYQCLTTRGEIATLEHDWKAADQWYGQLRRVAADRGLTGWSESLLARGDLDGAVAEAEEAHRASPHFADPLGFWAEALRRKGDYAGAAAKFAEADKYAPRWGRNHLLWGQALLQAGRRAEARAQFQAASGLDLSPADRAALNGLLASTARG